MKHHKNNTLLSKKNQGLTLIETLIALTLGLFIILSGFIENKEYLQAESIIQLIFGS